MLRPVHSDKVSRIAAGALSLLALVVYFLTLAPTVTGGDSGELIVAATQWGVAHPPGYPLWTVIAHGFSQIPFGSLAWRVNLMSAFCAAGTAGLLCRAVQVWTGRWWAGVLAGGLFAFSPLTWTYAVQAEVFALNNLLVASLCLAAVRFAVDGRLKYAYVGALFGGLSLSNHHTSVFVVAPIGLWMVVRIFQQHRKRAGRAIAIATGFGALGLVPYLYLPIAAHRSGGLIWGEPGTLSGLIAHFLRREYGTFQLASGESTSKVSLLMLLGKYFSSAFLRLLVVGLPLGLLGAWMAMINRKEMGKRSLAVAIVISLVGYLVVFQGLVNLSPENPLLAGVLARFWMQPDLLIALLAGVGIAVLVERKARAEQALVACVVALLFAQVGIHWKEQMVYGTAISDYGRAILSELPKDAVLLVRGDLPSNAVRYVQHAEGVRPDVKVLDQELLTRAWYVKQMKRRDAEVVFPGNVYDPERPDGFTLAQFYSANVARCSMWIYPETKGGDASVRQLTLWPEGMAQRVMAAGERPTELAAWDEHGSKVLVGVGGQFIPLWKHSTPGTWERVVVQDYWSAVHRHALALLMLALADATDGAALDRARVAYESFVEKAQGETWFAWKNLGMIYERLALKDPGMQARVVEAWSKYLELAPSNDPDRGAVAEAVRRYKKPGDAAQAR